jgi:hypothetical protein
MKRAWLLGMGAWAGAALGLMAIGQTEGYAGHGHSGGTHAAKETHEAPKHNSKPAPHPAPKSQSKSPSKPQSKAPKPLPKPSVHNPEHSHSNSAEHSSNPKHPNAITSNPNNQKTTKNETAHHDEHHDDHHHHWHHERHWHGHHLYWSGSSWVDAASGQPVVAADLTPPVEAAGAPLMDVGASPAPVAVGSGRPQIQFSVDSSERDSYEAAAQAAGMSREEWMRSRLNSAAHNELR